MFRSLDDWFASGQGQAIIRAFLAELESLRCQLHGDTLLQLGLSSDQTLSRFLRYQHKCLLSPCLTPATNLVASLTQLPLDSNSVDCVLAPLTMHAFRHEKNPLDEIDRVLKPMGHVVFFDINSFSLWGSWLRFSGKTCFGQDRGVLHSLFSMKRDLFHRGYVQTHLSGFYYLPPVASDRIRNKMGIFNVISKMISPMPCGFHCFVVQKHQEEGLLQRPRLQNPRAISLDWTLAHNRQFP